MVSLSPQHQHQHQNQHSEWLEDSISSLSTTTNFQKGVGDNPILKPDKKKNKPLRRRKTANKKVPPSLNQPNPQRRILRATPPPPLKEEHRGEWDQEDSDDTEVDDSEKEDKQYNKFHGVRELCSEQQKNVFEKHRQQRVDAKLSHGSESRRILEKEKREGVDLIIPTSSSTSIYAALCPQIFSVDPLFPEHKRKTDDEVSLLDPDKKRKRNIQNEECKKDKNETNAKEKEINWIKKLSEAKQQTGKLHVYGGMFLVVASLSWIVLKKCMQKK